MKTIVLIKPNSSGQYAGVEHLKACEPPMWLAILARYYEIRNYNPIIIDAELENLTSLETVESAKRFNPDEILILLTGNHPSSFVQMKATAEELETLFEMDGINITIKDYLPISPLKFMPKWESLPMDKYVAHNWHSWSNNGVRRPYGVIYSSVGCPYSCSFCNIKYFYQHNYTVRNLDDIMLDFDRLAVDYEIKNIKIMDELFAITNNRVEQICDRLIAREYSKDLNIWAYARIDTVSPELLELMRKAGIKWLAYGIETGDETIRKNVLKGKFDNKKIKEVIEMTKDSGINVLGNYMFGFWEDNLDTMQRTLDFAFELNCEYSNFYATVAYPGSRLYKDMQDLGVDVEREPIEYAQMSEFFRPLPTQYLNEKEVLRFRDKAFYEYYNNIGYLNMIKDKFGIETRNEILEMTKIKIERNILK